MHEEILTSEQNRLLEPLGKFSPDFGLVGGTAIALHIGHRRSIDFDMFSLNELPEQLLIKVKRTFQNYPLIVTYNVPNQLNLSINNVKVTFFYYPYSIKFEQSFETIFKLPNLLTLAAMKAHALGGRAKWKDYVDLYYIIKDHYTLADIITKGKELFEGEFNEKLLRTQLAYFEDINYSEEVIYLPSFERDDEQIKMFLTEVSLGT